MAQALRILKILGDNARKNGQQHGETLRDSIKEIAEIRLERMCKTSNYKTTKAVLELADEHIPLLTSFDSELYDELVGIGEGSNVSLARLVVLNNYTDMRDIDPAQKMDGDGCSIIYSPGAKGPVLGQTWDIHASACPFSMILKLKDQMLFSIAGCLGMTGINRQGVALAINNLASNDAGVGVIWPAIVRKALKQPDAKMAKEQLLKANNGSGRHYAITDDKNFFSIESSGTKKKVTSDSNDALFFHTNHCLDEEMRQTHTIKKESTTLARYQHLDEVVRHEKLDTAPEVFVALASVSIAINKNDPDGTATCATVAMDINDRSLLACSGTATKEFLACNQAIPF